MRSLRGRYKTRVGLATFLATTCSLAGLATGASAEDAESPPDATDRLWVMRLPGQSWADSLEDAAAQSPQQKERALDLVEATRERLNGADAVQAFVAADGTDSGVSLTRQGLDALQERLKEPEPVGVTATAGAEVSSEEVDSPTDGDGTSFSSAQPETYAGDAEEDDVPTVQDPSEELSTSTAVAYDPFNPNTFAVRGSRGSGRLFWQNMRMILEFGYFDSDNDWVVTDRYTSTNRVDPGAVSSRVTSNQVYLPNSKHFDNKHLDYFAVCRGSICNPQPESSGNLGSNRVQVVDQYGRRSGNVLTIAVTLWVYNNRFGRYYPDSAKTNDATCEAASSGNRCRY